MIEEIDMLLERIVYVSRELYKNNLNGVADEIREMFPKINQILLKLIGDSVRYEQIGIEVPQNILILQVKNFLEAYENKDVLMLADTMKYEIYEGLSYYRELLTNSGM